MKDLKDLENGLARVSIDIQGLKALKRHLLTLDNAGDRPPRYGNIETRGLSYGDIARIETGTAHRQEEFETRRSLLRDDRGGQAPALR